jgi:hypothetical protein
MQKIGKIADSGYTDIELQNAKTKFEDKSQGKVSPILHDLNDILPDGSEHISDASVLVVHNACKESFGIEPSVVESELLNLTWDRKKLMRGAVKNCNARINLCFSDFDQTPDIENGRGTVVSWDHVPNVKIIRDNLANFLGVKAQGLHAEGNYYHTPQGGIGFHGDGERKIVIALRFGAPLSLHYQAYLNSDPIGERLTIDNLKAGDLYVMGDKATGNNWKKKKIITFRHAAERVHANKPRYCIPIDAIKEARDKKKESNRRKKEEKKTPVIERQKESNRRKREEKKTPVIERQIKKLRRAGTNTSGQIPVIDLTGE